MLLHTLDKELLAAAVEMANEMFDDQADTSWNRLPKLIRAGAASPPVCKKMTADASAWTRCAE